MIYNKEEILENIELANKDALSKLIDNNVTILRTLNQMPLPEPIAEFKVMKFLKEMEPVLNQVAAKQKPTIASDIIRLTLEQFGVSLDEKESFVLFQLRDLGRFRIKDDKLFKDLEKQWGQFPSYRVEKSEFKYVLYELKKVGLIEIRRGTITLSEQIVSEH